MSEDTGYRVFGILTEPGAFSMKNKALLCQIFRQLNRDRKCSELTQPTSVRTDSDETRFTSPTHRLRWFMIQEKQATSASTRIMKNSAGIPWPWLVLLLSCSLLQKNKEQQASVAQTI